MKQTGHTDKSENVNKQDYLQIKIEIKIENENSSYDTCKK